MDSLAEHVRHLLEHAHDDPHEHAPTESYQSGFEGEGGRKTEFIVEELKRCERDGLFRVADCVAVSVGGADGSDLDALLSNSDIATAFLIEYSDEGAEAARAKAQAWRSKGKTFNVLQGDATLRKQDLIDQLRALPQRPGMTLVLIFLAVLHELPRRSTEKYDLRSYLGTLADVLPNNSIFISEPCAPMNWPETVELKIADLDANLLRRWSLYIKRSLWDNVQHPDPVAIGDGYVRMSRELAAETFFKTIRRHDVSRHLYEIGERLSSFNADVAIRDIRDTFVDALVAKTPRPSTGFVQAYRQSQVQARTGEGIPLPMPDSHVKIVGYSVRTAPLRGTPPAQHTAAIANSATTHDNARDKGATIATPILKIDSEYFIALNDSQKILFFREAERLIESGKTAFRVELAHVERQKKKLERLESLDRRSDKQRHEYLTVTENLRILEERTRRFESAIDALLRGHLRMPLGVPGSNDYYLQIARVLENAIRRVWTAAPAQDECCDVIIHTDAFRDGPHITARLPKSELTQADIREAGTELLRGPAEEYEGRILNFSDSARSEILYPSVMYIFLRDGFNQPLSGEYQSLDRWHVSPA